MWSYGKPLFSYFKNWYYSDNGGKFHNINSQNTNFDKLNNKTNNKTNNIITVQRPTYYTMLNKYSCQLNTICDYSSKNQMVCLKSGKNFIKGLPGKYDRQMHKITNIDLTNYLCPVCRDDFIQKCIDEEIVFRYPKQTDLIHTVLNNLYK